jgi:glycosyltransferase involved in cell wall biosynthesis
MNILTVVIPVLNEKAVIKEIVSRVKENVKTIDLDFEIIIIDDGSEDGTWDEIKREAALDKRIKGIKFSRNFGHHLAISAGLHNSKGDWVVVMDGDLQDRPEIIPNLYYKAQEGFDVVFVSRKKRPEKLYYRLVQKIFYVILRKLSGLDFDSTHGNFSIISRKVVLAFMNFPEKSRFYSSTIRWLGFNSTSLKADHGVRFAGKPSYTFKKRVKLARDIILAYSNRPLRASLFFGVSILIITLTFLVTDIYFATEYFNFMVVKELFGYLSVFLIGMIFICLGIMGVYIGQIFDEVKNRPLYIIDEKV